MTALIISALAIVEPDCRALELKNSKHELRNPKQVRISQYGIPAKSLDPDLQASFCPCGFEIVSDFELRVSDFRGH
jgi:hypothetical protein